MDVESARFWTKHTECGVEDAECGVEDAECGFEASSTVPTNPSGCFLTACFRLDGLFWTGFTQIGGAELERLEMADSGISQLNQTPLLSTVWSQKMIQSTALAHRRPRCQSSRCSVDFDGSAHDQGVRLQVRAVEDS